MQLTAAQQTLLKPHLVLKLEALSSEADCDVLADYLLELIKSDGSEAEVIAHTKEQLLDFLPDSGAFVDDVFRDVRLGAYDPAVRAKAQYEGRRLVEYGNDGPVAQGAAPAVKRKRGGGDEEDVEMETGEEGRYTRGRGRGGRAGWRGRGEFGRGGRGRGGYAADGFNPQATGFNPQASGFMPQQHQQQAFQPQPQMPFAFDPANPNPMALMQALQQAMGMVQNLQGGQQRRTGKRCRDFDTKGVCTRGANCPYDHGDNFEEFAPGNTFGARGFERGRGRGRGRGDRGTTRAGRGGRASFSSPAPVGGAKAIVVENIPAEHFNDESIRAFFGEFGMIEDVETREDRKLAIIRYTDHEGAQTAFSSPKVVFDNRFVRVYWYRAEHSERRDGQHDRGGRNRGRGGMNGHGDGDTQMDEGEKQDQIDPEAFRIQQEAAQRRFEELKAAKEKRNELEAKMKAQAEERAELMRKLAEKTKGKAVAVEEGATANGADVHGIGMGASAAPAELNGEKSSSQTEALKAKLAALEAEARSIGLNPDASSTQYHDFAARGRGRGFVPRGSYAGRGAWHGRGRGSYGGVQGGAVKRLDNRPRGFTVAFGQGKTYDDMHEGLKQYMLFSDLTQSAKVSKHPGRDDAAFVVFTERYKAEMFLAAVQSAGGELTHVGTVDVAWAQNSDLPPDSFPEVSEQQHQEPQPIIGSWAGGSTGGTDEGMEDVADVEVSTEANAPREGAAQQGQGQAEMNYDVADDDDERWLAE